MSCDIGHDEQRMLGRLIFPEMAHFIHNKKYCYKDIFAHIIKFEYRAEYLKRLLNDDRVPQQWFYEWALYIGNKDLLIDRITEPKWAFYWALNIGNRNVMQKRITNIMWAYRWLAYIGDSKYLRKFIKSQNQNHCHD